MEKGTELNVQRWHTCNAAAVGNSHSTEAVVWDGCDFTGAPGPVVVTIFCIRVGHRVRVIRVQVIAAFRALKETHNQSSEVSFLWRKQDLISC